MEMDGCQEIDLEFEGHDLIENYHFSDMVDAKKEVNRVGNDANDHLPELNESAEPERNQRNGRYNLRKSLAWDSAFFTNAGVLDPEELSSMIIQSDKKEKHMLPGIQEEITGSTESISTLQSDSLTLDTNEDDLFMDIRASIQRSSKKASNLTNSSSKIAPMVLDGTTISSPKKEYLVPQNKIPKPGVKKTTGLQTVRMSKTQLKPIGKVAPGRSIKPDSVQSQAGSIGKTEEKNSGLPKPLKTMSCSVPSSTTAKRDSVGIGRVKPECGSSKPGSVSGKVSQLPKASALGGSRKLLPTPAVSSKCSALRSSTTSSVRSSTSSDNSVNTSSRNAAKPTLMAARRNIGKNSNISTESSGSIPKTSSRALPKNKLPASTLSTYLKSTKISSNVSPASSISEWSSVSSPTSSVVNQRSNSSRTSLDTGSCRSVDGDNTRLDPRNNVAGQKAQRQGNQGAISTSNTSKKSSTTSGTLQAPGKPSGLRLPSPKIGFFDGSTSRTPNGKERSQSALHPVMPKSGTATSTPTRSSTGKLKSAKVPAARVATSSANKKAGSPKAASPASSQEKPHALVKASSFPTHEKDSSSSSLGVKVNEIDETGQVAVEIEVETRVKEVVDADTGGHDTDNSVDSCLNKTMSTGDIKTCTVEGTNISGSEYISVITDGLIKKDDLDTSSVLSSGAIEKENYPANHESNCQLLINTTECVLSSTTAASNAASCRPPSALTSFSSSNEYVDKPKELVIQVAVAEDTGFALPSSSSEYISQIENGLIMMESMDDVNNNLIQTSEAVEKENNPANHELNHQLLTDTTECVLSSTAAASDAAPCSSPFALKNFSCCDEYVDKPTELVIQVAVAEDTGFALPSSSSEYISQIENGLITMDEDTNNLIPTSEAVDKENNPANHELNHQLLTDTTECALSSTAAASNAASCRPPSALTSFSSSNEYVDKPTELVIQVAVAEDTGFALPSSSSEYISQIENGLIMMDEDNNYLNPTSEAVEKENNPANHELNHQLPTDATECALSSTAAASDAAPSSSPFALKIFSCSDEYVDKPTELVIQVAVAEATDVALPSSGSENISQIEDDLIKKDELKKNSVPTFDAIEKENDHAIISPGEVLTGDRNGIYQENHDPNPQHLVDASECVLSSTAAAADAASYRPPFALKNSYCSNECVDKKPTDPAVLAENTGSALPYSERENS